MDVKGLCSRKRVRDVDLRCFFIDLTISSVKTLLLDENWKKCGELNKQRAKN